VKTFRKKYDKVSVVKLSEESMCESK